MQPGADARRCACRNPLHGRAATQRRGRGRERHGRIATADQDARVVAARDVSELGRQPRLAHAGGTAQSQDAAVAVDNVPPRVGQRRERGASSHHRPAPQCGEHRIRRLPGGRSGGRGRGIDLRRGREVLDRQQERRVLTQHRRMQRLQVRTRVETELLGEPLLGLVVGRERVRLSAGSVQRHHELAGELLVEGVCGHHMPQPRHDVTVLSQRERRRRRGLLGPHPKLGEPGDRGRGEVRGAQVVENVPTPEGQGVAQQRGRPIGFTDSERLLTPMDETLEDVRVEVVGVEDEAVPGRCRLESVVGARGRQHPAHRGDVGTQRRRRTLGCGLAPQRRDQPVATAWSVAAEEQQSQQLPSPWAAQGHRPVRGVDHLQRTQDAEARGRGELAVEDPLGAHALAT